MPEWRPGVLEGLLADIEKRGRVNQRKGMLLIANAIEAKAKAKLGQRTHRYGTRTPAGRGEPPALVTGAGRRSITHETVHGAELIVKVGTAAGVFPPASVSSTGQGSRSRQAAGTGDSRGKTPTSKYLLYQETLTRFQHPFLKPSFNEVVAGQVAIWLKSFRDWPRI